MNKYNSRIKKALDLAKCFSNYFNCIALINYKKYLPLFDEKDDEEELKIILLKINIIFPVDITIKTQLKNEVNHFFYH